MNLSRHDRTFETLSPCIHVCLSIHLYLDSYLFTLEIVVTPLSASVEFRRETCKSLPVTPASEKKASLSLSQNTSTCSCVWTLLFRICMPACHLRRRLVSRAEFDPVTINPGYFTFYVLCPETLD